MDVDIAIRLAKASDVSRLARFLNKLRAENGSTDQTSVPLPVDQGGPLYVLVAEDRATEEFVGAVAAQRCYQLIRGQNYLLLTDIYVLKDMQRHGVATLLTNEAMAVARRIGCDSVAIIIEDGNSAALATASRAGFHEVKESLLRCEL